MTIARNLEALRSAVAEACARVKRDVSGARILAVSKMQPAEVIEEAYAAGQRDFGENYVPELLEKSRRLAHLKDLRWHLIGHLQTNKTKTIAAPDFPALAAFHALDSEKLARALVSRLTAPLSVFVEVNIDAEPSKSGPTPESAAALVAVVRSQPLLTLRGLMCMPAPSSGAEATRRSFQRLAALARTFETGAAGRLELSMGMSGDFEMAVEEGSDWIRVGTRLFGARPKKT